MGEPSEVSEIKIEVKQEEPLDIFCNEIPYDSAYSSTSGVSTGVGPVSSHNLVDDPLITQGDNIRDDNCAQLIPTSFVNCGGPAEPCTVLQEPPDSPLITRFKRERSSSESESDDMGDNVYNASTSRVSETGVALPVSSHESPDIIQDNCIDQMIPTSFVICGSPAEPEPTVDSTALQEPPDSDLPLVARLKRGRSSSESDGECDGEGAAPTPVAINPYYIYIPTWTTSAARVRKIEFQGERKILIDSPEKRTPIDWFNLFLDEDWMKEILKRTNEEGTAQKKLVRVKKEWTELSMTELQTFIGILLHMGTVKCNRLQDYWSKDPMFSIQFAKEKMVLERFQVIMRALSVEPSAESSASPVVAQARAMIQRFNDAMARAYSPGRNLVMEDGVMTWKGAKYWDLCTTDELYNTDRGFKLYSVSEVGGPVVRLVCSPLTYTTITSPKLVAQHETRVLQRMLQRAGHVVRVNTGNLGFEMSKALLHGPATTYSSGFLRPDSKDIPSHFRTLPLGEGQSAAVFADGVMMVKWRRRSRDVYYLTTEPEDAEPPLPETAARLRRDDRGKAHMAGVTTPLVDYQPTFFARLQWHKRTFLHLLQVAMLNAHKLHTMAGSRLEFHWFRLEVIRELLGLTNHQPKAVGKLLRKRIHLGQSTTSRHQLAKENVRTRDGTRLRRRRCKMCTVDGSFTQTIYMCRQCPDTPGLCAVGCFDRFHSLLGSL